MKINFPSLFQTPVHKYNFFFIFGNDTIVFERVISYLQKKFSSPIDIKTEEDLLKAGASQPSLFETSAPSSLTLISPVTDKILKHADQLKEGLFIFTSEKARAQSKLVTYFTQSSRALAIAAYSSPLVTSEFAFLVEEMNLPVAFKGLLLKAYQNDYMGLLTALEKIKLYGDVPESHYASFLGSSPSDEMTPLIHALLLKDLKKTTDTFSLIAFPDLIPFLRSLTRSFQSLFELMPFQKSPNTISWQKLSPPVFFKEQPLYEAALSKWRPYDVQAFLETLLSLERQIKFSETGLSQVRHALLSGLSSIK